MSSLFYRKIGTGQPLIIIHGLLGSSENWLTFAKKLQKRFTVYLVDLRNHGQSFHSDHSHFVIMAEDILRMMETENIQQPIIFGHSLGGKVAMQMTQLWGALIHTLILIDILPDALPLDRFGDLFSKLLNFNLVNHTARTSIDQALQVFIPDSSFRQFLMKNIKRNQQGKFIWQCNLSVLAHHIPSFSEAIVFQQKFLKPTLFIRGALSSYIPIDQLAYAYQMFPLLSLTTIPAAGHWVYTDQPVAFTQALFHFLKKS